MSAPKAAAPKTAAPTAIPTGDSCVVLDVRTGLEHDDVSLRQPHLHVPLSDLKPAEFLKENNIDASKPIYLLCRGGKRATQAAEAFIAAGHDNVHVVEGGIVACEAVGVPVKKGDVISLERQVRIAAGLLVVTGVALGALVSPLAYGLSVFVGAGLVFAGVTDKCGMALVLARAPWNAASATPAATCSTGKTACCPTESACASTQPAENDETVRMPSGTAFYSPASGKPAPLQVYKLTPTGGSAGGCS